MPKVEESMSKNIVEVLHRIGKCLEQNEQNEKTLIKTETSITNGLIVQVFYGNKVRTFMRFSSGQESEEVFNGDAVVNQPCDILKELEKLEKQP